LKVDAKKAAELARIKMSDEEIERLQRDLDEMVEIFKKLIEDKELDGYEPMYTPSEAESASRPDSPGEVLGDKWLDLVPLKEEREDGVYVKSPRP